MVLKRHILKLHIGIFLIRQFQCVQTTFVTVNKENFFLKFTLTKYHCLISLISVFTREGSIDLRSVCPSIYPLKYGSRDNSNIIHASMMKLVMRSDGNVLIMHIIYFRRRMIFVVAMETEIVKSVPICLLKYGFQDNSKTIYAS